MLFSGWDVTELKAFSGKFQTANKSVGNGYGCMREKLFPGVWDVKSEQ